MNCQNIRAVGMVFRADQNARSCPWRLLTMPVSLPMAAVQHNPCQTDRSRCGALCRAASADTCPSSGNRNGGTYERTDIRGVGLPPPVRIACNVGRGQQRMGQGPGRGAVQAPGHRVRSRSGRQRSRRRPPPRDELTDGAGFIRRTAACRLCCCQTLSGVKVRCRFAGYLFQEPGTAVQVLLFTRRSQQRANPPRCGVLP